MSSGATNEQDGRGHWLAWAALACVYVFIATRYPLWANDDTYLLTNTFPRLDAKAWWWRLWELIFYHSAGLNEFRTYGLAKLLQYGLWREFGAGHVAYYYAMATLFAASGIVLACIVRRLTASAATATLALGAWLFNPFALFQDFHHYSYIALPALFVGAYVLAMLSPAGRARTVVSCLAAAAATMTGEVGAPLVLAAGAALVLRQRDQWKLVAAQAAMVVGIIVVLYLGYRFTAFEPGKPPRHVASHAPLLDRALTYGTAFLGMLGLVVAGNDTELTLSRAATFDLAAILLSGAAAGALAVVAWRGVRAQHTLPVAVVLVALAVVAAVPYLALGTFAGAAAVPYRYAQLSGILLFTGLALALSRFPVVSLAIPAIGIVGFAITFGVRVPSVAREEAAITQRVASLRTPQSRAVLMTPANGLIAPRPMQLYFPATSALQHDWAAVGFAQLEWGLTLVETPTASAPSELITP